MSSSDFDSFASRIRNTGLAVRGAFHVEEDDGVPGGGAGLERTLILIGNAGSRFWYEFEQSTEYQDGGPDPLDRWSERVITGLGRELDAHPLFPFKGPPYYPFQRWARRAESVTPSPLGMLIHPDFGLWHAYRGALVVDRRLEGLAAKVETPSPCLSCRDQPCLSACPVDAFGPGGFDSDGCAVHLSGDNACLDQGCLARNACPAGKPFRYMREQHRFHLAAFHRAHRRDPE